MNKTMEEMLKGDCCRFGYSRKMMGVDLECGRRLYVCGVCGKFLGMEPIAEKKAKREKP